MSDERNSELTAASDVLQELLEHTNNPLADQFTRWKIWKKWKDIAGPTISKNSLPVGYYEGTLYVWVRNSVWMQEFIFIATPLKEKINTYVGRNWVNKVKFTLNKHEVPNFDESLAAESILE